MQFFTHQQQPGILVTTMEGVYNKPGDYAQNDNSVFGKIIFIKI